MQALDGLEHDLHLRLERLRTQEFHNLGRDLLIGERSVDVFHLVLHLVERQVDLFLTSIVCINHLMPHTALLQQFHCSLEGDEVVHCLHIDTVEVRVTDLGR